MGKTNNLTNRRFGRLVALEINGKRRSYNTWLCKCDCGNYHTVTTTHLMGGYTNSCGCLAKEVAASKFLTHGMKGTPEYEAWSGMKTRCYNINEEYYYNYGGRGIQVCQRWLHSFENFLIDMGRRPSKNHSLDRFPDNDGDYGPDNCRWATRKEQSGNKRTNRWIDHAGERLTLQGWSEKTGISKANLWYYLKRHTLAEAIEHYKNKVST